jgi:hypothetical protein
MFDSAREELAGVGVSLEQAYDTSHASGSFSTKELHLGIIEGILKAGLRHFPDAQRQLEGVVTSLRSSILSQVVDLAPSWVQSLAASVFGNLGSG